MKKVLSLVMIITILLTTFTSFTFADVSSDSVLEKIEVTNDIIDSMIVEAQVKADGVLNRGSDNVDKELDEIIKELVKDTDKLAKEMIKEAEKEGILAVCELVKVEIGGREVLVDPIRVLTVD